jgi:uncharacterized repeat protein (TIGR01451 family)
MKKPALLGVIILLFIAVSAAVDRPFKEGPFLRSAPRDTAFKSKSIPAGSASSAVIRDFGKIPIYFIPNEGQVEGPAKFYIQGKDKTVYFTPEGVTYALSYGAKPSFDKNPIPRQVPDTNESRRWAVKMDFIGARQDVVPEGLEETGGVISYFRGKPEDWHAGLPSYVKIIYRDLWPGIDLVYRGDIDKLKYEFIVHPGADPGVIRMALSGAKKAWVDEAGRLEIETPAGRFADETPTAYQDIDGRRVDVPMAFKLENSDSIVYSYSFSISDYVKTCDLVLDPATIVYCGFIGGSSDEAISGLVLDKAGYVYVTGFTLSGQSTFPVTVGPDLTFNGSYHDAFVAKVNPSGMALVYCGYIGGTGLDIANAIAVDTSGNVYIAGTTLMSQPDFPVVVGPDLTFNGSYDGFIAKVNYAGTALVYCGYIGGSGLDSCEAIAVDGTGNAYVTGFTESTPSSFPVLAGPDLTYNGGTYDGFVAKVNAGGTGLVYCGYIGGAGRDEGSGLAVDGSGNAYITGRAGSAESSFPVKVGPDLTYNGGTYDAFAAKINAGGTALVYCGYVGGSGEDIGNDIAVDAEGNAFIAGQTDSNAPSFPVKGGPDLTQNGGSDAFISKINPDGTALIYCGYIGGSENDYGNAIALDPMRNAYIVGAASSTESTFPVRGGPGLVFKGGGTDAFIAEVSADGAILAYCGYIGGGDQDKANAVAVDEARNVFIGGSTYSTQSTFPVAVGPDLTFNGGSVDAFVAKISNTAEVAVKKSTNNLSPVQGTEFGFTVTVKNNGPLAASWIQVYDKLPAGLSFVSATPSTGTYTESGGLWVLETLAKDATATLVLTAKAYAGGAIKNTASIVGLSEYDPLFGNNSASVTVNPKVVQPPTNFAGQKILNRSLSMISYVAKLTWQANPDNADFTVSKVRIYRMDGGVPTLLAELDASKTPYYDRNVQKGTEYQYGIAAVTDKGYESEKTYVTVK